MVSLSENLGSRRFVLLVCFFIGAILTFQAIRIWVADYRVHSNRIDQMERGVPDATPLANIFKYRWQGGKHPA